MAVRLDEVRAGSVVKVRGNFGNGLLEKATVDNVEADIKNGRAGIDYTAESGGKYWAYLEQVKEVIKY